MEQIFNKILNKVFYWTQRAATQGLAEAEANLSWFYETGFGTPKNPEQAFFWAKKLQRKKYLQQ